MHDVKNARIVLRFDRLFELRNQSTNRGFKRLGHTFDQSVVAFRSSSRSRRNDRRQNGPTEICGS